MIQIGYKLSSEEHGPRELVTNALAAEEAGFEFALISDHYHPWIDRQGHSPFVWGVLGGIAATTRRLRVGTGVTCPTIRIHPAIVAHAAATAADLMPGRFFLGVGTGENLNEHILGDRWPPASERLDMLEEAIGLIRELWKGDYVSHVGRHYRTENARIYSLPEQPPPIYVAGAGPKAIALAGRIGDGFVGVAPDEEMVERFRSSGGGDKPRYGEVHVCWADSAEEGRKIAHEWWPNVAMQGELGQELRTPSQFEDVVPMVSRDDVAEVVPCGPDPEDHIGTIRKFVDAGYDHVCVHQIGPDQAGFLRFYEQEVLPKLR